MDIPNLKFRRDGGYSMGTRARRIAAARSMLRNISLIPQCFAHKGPEWCRDEMCRLAIEGARMLADAEDGVVP